MYTDAQFNLESVKLSTLSRVTRIAFGAVLLAVTMSHGGVLGILAVLPLVAIYPILTGLLGYSLVELLFVNERRIERPARLGPVPRAVLLALGAGLIGAVMGGTGAPAWVALLGIYPILVGGLGVDLLGEAMMTRRALQSVAKPVRGETTAYPLTKETRHIPFVEAEAQKAA
jgi:hypothetical protein